MKRGWGALIVTLITVAFITPAVTGARFSSRSSSLESFFEAGSFSPGVAPTPSVSLDALGVRLRWPSVSFPGSSTIEYRVRRSTSSGSSSDVCDGVASPALVDGEVSCLDSSAQRAVIYTYAIQPALTRNGSPTWNLEFGSESAAISNPGLTFAGAGPVVSTTSAGLVTVPYPSETKIGDLLVLVVVNGRNKGPRRPNGWADVVSRGIGGSQDFHLYSAQRVADAANSVIVDVDTGVEGATLRMYRYDVPAGSPAPVVRARQVQSGFTTTATAQMIPTPDIVTTAAAMAISIVAVRANNTLSLLPGSAWTLRATEGGATGTTPISCALADAAVGSAVSVPSPTWQQSENPSRWIFGGSAFG